MPAEPVVQLPVFSARDTDMRDFSSSTDLAGREQTTERPAWVCAIAVSTSERADKALVCPGLPIFFILALPLATRGFRASPSRMTVWLLDFHCERILHRNHNHHMVFLRRPINAPTLRGHTLRLRERMPCRTLKVHRLAPYGCACRRVLAGKKECILHPELMTLGPGTASALTKDKLSLPSMQRFCACPVSSEGLPTTKLGRRKQRWAGIHRQAIEKLRSLSK